MTKQSMLHEILAVEADAQGTANRIIPETIHTFKEKAAHFNGAHRTLKLFASTGDDAAQIASEKAEEQHQEMVTTVLAKLEYTLGQVSRYWDVVLQKEATNQDATADLITANGTVIATGLPATFLLGMEAKLKTLRSVYEMIPTLAPGIKWVADASLGKDVYRVESPEIRAKTAKSFQHKVLVAPSDKHPAQIEKWEETINVGAYTKEVWSSAMTATDKSLFLGRIDDLIQATKQARQRANSTPVRQETIASKLIKFIHPNGF